MLFRSSKVLPQHPPKIDPQWLSISLDHPLIHNQSGTKIHIVGMQPSSVESAHRLSSIIHRIRPSVLAIQCPQASLSTTSKRCEALKIQGETSETLLSKFGVDPHARELELAWMLAEELKAQTVGIDIRPESIMAPETHALASHLQAIRLHYRVPALAQASPSSFGRKLYDLVHSLQLRNRMKGDAVAVADYQFARRLYGTFFPKEFNAVLLAREAIMVDSLKRIIRRMTEEGKTNERIVAVVGKIHGEGLFNTWDAYGKSYIVRGSPSSTTERSTGILDAVPVVTEKRVEAASLSDQGIIMVGRTTVAPLRNAAPMQDISLPEYMKPLSFSDSIISPRVQEDIGAEAFDILLEKKTVEPERNAIDVVEVTRKKAVAVKKPTPLRPKPTLERKKGRGIQYID
ncbi:hypothetical protein BC829DRAFT_104452 [Chytridium lagenaria]|nr:hypothetical protein BC829DRAFT_104452 [Chytridium lagenaria]